MKHYLVIITFLTVSICAFGQKSTLLKNIEQLKKQCQTCESIEDYIQYCTQNITEYKKNGKYELVANYIYLQLYLSKREQSTSKITVEEGIKYAKLANNNRLLTYLYSDFGSTLNIFGNYKQAIKKLDSAAYYNHNHTDVDYCAFVLHYTKSIAYESLSQYSKALEQAHLAVSFAKKERLKLYVKSKVAHIYFNKKALPAFQAIANYYMTQKKDDWSSAQWLNNVADVYGELNQIEL